MDLAGGEFYTSGTFWAAAGAIAVVVGAIATVWVTVRAANPKRRLLYAMPVITPLLNRPADLPQVIEVRRVGQDRPLAHPHVVNVEITNKGRLDIRREAFDDEPLCLDVDALIIEKLNITTVPSDHSIPSWKIDGSKLLVGPDVIKGRQTITFSLLVDGRSPSLKKPLQSLIDVDVLPKEEPGAWPLRWLGLSFLGYLGLVAIFVFTAPVVAAIMIVAGFALAMPFAYLATKLESGEKIFAR